MSASAQAPLDAGRRIARLAELLVLYAGIPTALALRDQRGRLLPVLWAVAALVGLLLWRDPSFDRRRLCGWCREKAEWRALALRFAAAALLLTVALWWYRPGWLFRLPQQRPVLWALLMVLYPLLSVLPQGLIFRALYQHRYAPAFRSPRLALVAGAALFSLAHVPFGNGIAPLFTLFGGALFLRTYARTGSLAMSCVEHALYGNLLFTLGWGIYFYHGVAG